MCAGRDQGQSSPASLQYAADHVEPANASAGSRYALVVTKTAKVSVSVSVSGVGLGLGLSGLALVLVSDSLVLVTSLNKI